MSRMKRLLMELGEDHNSEVSLRIMRSCKWEEKFAISKKCFYSKKPLILTKAYKGVRMVNGLKIIEFWLSTETFTWLHLKGKI